MFNFLTEHETVAAYQWDMVISFELFLSSYFCLSVFGFISPFPLGNPTIDDRSLLPEVTAVAPEETSAVAGTGDFIMPLQLASLWLPVSLPDFTFPFSAGFCWLPVTDLANGEVIVSA